MATLGTFAAFASRGFTGSGQFSLADVKFPTGGNYIIDDDGLGNRVHVFTSSGTFAIPADVVTSSTVSLKVLAVGGGGDAGGLTYYNSNSTINDDNAGGGGAGGSVVYSSGFTAAKGMSFAVTVGSVGGTSSFEGLPAAVGGGDGGISTNFSRGEPGGRGGGGSWQNGRPSGPRASAEVAYSNRHPGYWYGTSGPAAPANYNQVTITALGPSYAPVPSCTIPITFKNSFHGVGNHQYRSASPTPDSSVSGLANDSPYGGSFRSRGGGGASMTGGFGGQALRTNFFKAQHNGTTYEWFGAGGHGKPGNEYATIGTYPNAYVWRDVGHNDDGDVLATEFVSSSTPSGNKFLSGYQNQYVGDNLNAGYNGIGSGGGFNNPTPNPNGVGGRIRIAYKLADYPGGDTAATANIFGGTITYSTDGAWRYHDWISSARASGASINSQGWHIDSSWVPRQYNQNYYNDATNWPQRANPYDGYQPGTIGGAIANTSPFYYYGDIPSVTNLFKYMIVGGGGARGRGGDGGAADDSLSDYQEYHYGGGGSGGVVANEFTPTGYSSTVFNVESLQTSFKNTKEDGSDTRWRTDDIGHRPGFISVHANSLLNPRLDSSSFEYVDSDKVAGRVHRERNGKIRLAAKCKNGAHDPNTDGQAPLVNFLRCFANIDLTEGIWGNDTMGTTGNQSGRGWLVFYTPGNAAPADPYTAYVNPVARLTTYDSYFYNDFFRVILHGTNDTPFTNTIPGTGDVPRYIVSSQKGNWTGSSLGAGATVTNISQADKALYFQENVATGIHPASQEPYYNMILVNQRIPRWQKGRDRWSQFWNNVVESYGKGYPKDSGNPKNLHRGGATSNWEVQTPAMVAGLENIDNVYTRTVSGINGETLEDANKDIALQYVVEQAGGQATRRMEYRGIAGSIDISIPPGWRMVQDRDTHNSDAKLWKGTTVCVTNDTNDSLRGASVKLYVWLLRKIVVRRFFVHDIQVGNGGVAGKIGPVRYRSGGPSCFHKMNEDTPQSIFAGGGGSGGHLGYTATTGDGTADGTLAVGVTAYPQGQSDNLFTSWGDGTFSGSRWGSAGGGSWRQTDQTGQSTSQPSRMEQGGGSGSAGVDAYGGGGTGGGSVKLTSGPGGFIFYGAPRGSQVSDGRKNNSTDKPNDDGSNGIETYGRGGGGFFGSGTGKNWTSNVNSIVCGPDTYYYALNMDVFPHNASFSAGGGGGALGNGGDGTNVGPGGTGGAGGAGFSSSITGFSIPYGAGGGAFGRVINGSPGSSLLPNPADQPAATGSPVGTNAPAYFPFGTGGGWSAGKQEGGGADGGATKYYPGSGPWPASYPVNMGEQHMDAMRFWYASPAVPSPQKGDVGRPYGGKQGVVIISYNKGQFIYPV
jgi:hypothetical protein